MKFIHIGTGKEYTEDIPDNISIIVSEEQGDLIVGKKVSASKGDKHYQDVLISWMYRRGYIALPDKKQTKSRQVKVRVKTD